MKKLFLVICLFSFPFLTNASSFCASGFGDPLANGTYDPVATYNGHTTYYNVNDYVSFFPTNGNGWYLNDVLTESYAFYYDATLRTNPWENSWTLSSGDSPAGLTVIDACDEEPTASSTGTTTITYINVENLENILTIGFGFIIFFSTFFGLLFYFKRQTILK